MADRRRSCEVCGERPAAVPDRNRIGRPIKRICRECHAARLRGDLRKVLKAYEQKKNIRPGCWTPPEKENEDG